MSSRKGESRILDTEGTQQCRAEGAEEDQTGGRGREHRVGRAAEPRGLQPDGVHPQRRRDYYG